MLGKQQVMIPILINVNFVLVLVIDLVKACVVAACCPKPSEDDPAGLNNPLLPNTGQGIVDKQPDLNHMSESGPNSGLYDVVDKREVEVCGSVPYMSFTEDSVTYKKRLTKLSMTELSEPDVTISNGQLTGKK